MVYKLLRTLLPIAITLLQPPLLKAQLNNRIFEQTDTITPNDTQTVRIHFESLNFLRNTEYFDIIETGQTYLGTMLQAHLSYQPHKNVLIKGGLLIKQDYGSNRLQSIAPVFSLSIFKHGWRHNFGMIQGSTNLGLIEPMMNIDRAITNRVQNGLQSIYRHKHNYFTNWVVWDVPTYRGAANQEQFNIGFVLDKNIVHGKKLTISFPFQGTLTHRGGQINTGDVPIFSRMNLATGLKLAYRFTPEFSVRTENYFLRSDDFSPTITQPYKNGDANWHTLAFKYRNTELMLNYWVGREWQSPIGSQIYNNYNFYDVYQYRRVRHMAFIRLFYTKKIYDNLMLDLRLEPFYDFEYGVVQYSYSVYLRFNLSRTLGKI